MSRRRSPYPTDDEIHTKELISFPADNDVQRFIRLPRSRVAATRKTHVRSLIQRSRSAGKSLHCSNSTLFVKVVVWILWAEEWMNVNVKCWKIKIKSSDTSYVALALRMLFISKDIQDFLSVMAVYCSLQHFNKWRR